MKIKFKITIAVVLMISVTISAVGFFTYRKSADTIMELTEYGMKDVVKNQAVIISSVVENEHQKTKILAREKAIIDLTNYAKLSTAGPEYDALKSEATVILTAYASETDSLDQIFLADEKGSVLSSSDPGMIGQSIADKNYAKQLLSSGKASVSDIISSEIAGENVVVFATPIYSDNTLTGFIGCAIKWESITSYIANAKVFGTKSSYAYIVNSNGNMMYHPTTDKIGKPVENEVIKGVVSRLSQGDSVGLEYVAYDYNGALKLAAYDIIPETNWIVVLTGDAEEVKAPAAAMGDFVLLLGALSAALASLVAFVISMMITKPIVKVTELINKTAELDLKSDAAYQYLSKNKDETGIIAKATFVTRQALRDMAQKLSITSQTVYENANNIAELCSNVQSFAHDNSATTEELSAGMEETAASSEEVTATIEEIEGNIELIAQKVREGTNTSEGITQRALSLKNEAVASVDNARQIYDDVKQKMQYAIEQSNSINQINTLADTILNITNQTNLLALNAAIEAARAGEAGKGFSVVADEIRKLAEESSKTVGDIQNIVGSVIDSVKNMNNSSDAVLSFLEEKVLKDYEKLVDISGQYNNDSQLINQLMVDFDSAAEQLTASISNIANAVNEVAATVNEGAKGVQDIAEKNMDIVDKTIEVSKMADENIQSTKHLNQLVESFKL